MTSGKHHVQNKEQIRPYIKKRIKQNIPKNKIIQEVMEYFNRTKPSASWLYNSELKKQKGDDEK